MTFRTAYLTPSGEHISVSSLLGNGRSGLVLRDGSHALKIPKVSDTSHLPAEQSKDQNYVNESNRTTLGKEKDVYRRLKDCDGVAKAIKISEEGILLEFFPEGDLEIYMREHVEPNANTKISWILSVTRTIHSIHEMKVLVEDIASRNFLVATDKCLKLIDFGESSVFPEDTDMAKADDRGTTIYTDMFHVGCLIYSIAVWTKFEHNLFEHEFNWPAIADLPSLDGILYCQVIEKCWTRRYRSSQELYEDVCQRVDSCQ